jgi:hypothetical protein
MTTEQKSKLQIKELEDRFNVGPRMGQPDITYVVAARLTYGMQ